MVSGNNSPTLVLRGPVNGAALFIIAPNLDEWEIKAQISEQDIGKLQSKMKELTLEQIAKGVGVPVRFSVEAYSAEKIKFTGKVLRIDPLPAASQRFSCCSFSAYSSVAVAVSIGHLGN